MVNRELCSRNTPGPLTQQTQPGKYTVGHCTARSGLGAWLRNFGQLPNIKFCSKTLHTVPQSPRIHLVRLSFWLGAYVESQPGRCHGWAWGGGLDPPKTKNVFYIFTQRTPGLQNSYGAVKILVRSLCRLSARGVAWVSLGRPV